ncbi:MAG: gliding motility-associated C-terminal domain-containing protein [Bacteroidota bacterium]
MKNRILYLKGLPYPIRLLAVIAAFFLISEYSFGQQMVVSSYFNAGDPRDEWSELLVVQDNLDIRNWSYGDNNASQTSWQTRINFNNIDFWQYLRAGTIIIIWHRPVNSLGIDHPEDLDPSDGFIQLRANNAAYFNGGDFGTSPTWGGNSLNVANTGDLLQIRDPANIHVHVLGHLSTAPASAAFTGLPLPKLNLPSVTLTANEVVMACPQSTVAPTITQYGTLPPQNGAFYATNSTVDLTFGLPNIRPSNMISNSLFWRSLRQPSWPAPNPGFTVNGTNHPVLTWDPIPDPVTTDGTTGYLILRNTVDDFSVPPADGTFYALGDLLGTATVVNPSLAWSYTDTWTDNSITVPCNTGLYYRVYPFRYATDNINGNNYNAARGRAYNETEYAAIHVTIPTPADLTSLTADQNTYCADNIPASVTLTATGGDGVELRWYAGAGCSGTHISTGASLVLSPAPNTTTTYSVHWWTPACGTSICEEITITVNPVNNHSVTIAAAPGSTVCEGEQVTVTATPVSSASPSYQWLLDGNPVGADQDTYTFIPVNGNQVNVELTSTEVCSANPATAVPITFTVNPMLVPAIVIDPVAPSVCTGTSVTFTATPDNEGSTPLINWYVNGGLQATTGLTFTYTPANNDQVYAMLTSSEACVSLATVNSNTATVTVTASYTLAVTIAADDNDVCENTTVNFTATVVSGGSGVTYEWFVNGGLQTGFNTSTFSYIPADGDQVNALMYDNAVCAIGSPAGSNTETINVSANVAVDVSLAADNLNPCEGTDVVFTATPQFPGTTPVYAWYLNGGLQTSGVNPQFTLSSPSNGDEVYVILTSSEPCTSVNGVQSATLTVTVTPLVTPTVELTPDQTSICAGSTVTFTAEPTGEGTNPSYVFHVNGAAQAPQGSPVFVWSPNNGDSFYVTLTSNALCASVTSVDSETETITVSTNLPVDIVLVDPGQICSGNPAVFTANPVNQGATPVYEWFINGSLTATTSVPTYSHPTPADGDQVFVRLTNNESCATGSPDDSQTITLVLVTSVVPSLTIAPDAATICSGSPVEFTADPVNGGGLPVYQWFVDGIEQTGITGSTLTITPAADISVYAVMQSNAQCAVPASAQSLDVVVTVTASYDVSVTALYSGGAICSGDQVRISAIAVNEGPAPAYQWYLNGSAVAGETNPDYYFIPADADEVYVELTNNETCANQHVVTSVPVQLPVNQPFVVSLAIAPDLASVCNGEQVTYTATPDNGGTLPSYQWFVNSILQPETSGTFTYVPQADDQVYAIVTSSETCVTGASATSAEETVAVVTGPAAAVTLSSNAAEVCQGEPVTFTAAPDNEGLTPVYRWLVNGVADPAAIGIEYSYVPANGDQVTIEMTSSENCATNNPAFSVETVALSPCGFVLQVPNAFTPDNDLLNDVFRPVLGEILPSKYLLQVFNRWGEIVFETNNPDEAWDGTFLGNPASRGTYIYKLEFEVPEYITNSIESPMRGFVMLLR